MSDEIKIIVKNATHAIILCRADQYREADNWRKFFSELNIPIAAEIISELKGDERVQMDTDGVIRGKLAGISA